MAVHACMPGDSPVEGGKAFPYLSLVQWHLILIDTSCYCAKINYYLLAVIVGASFFSCGYTVSSSSLEIQLSYRAELQSFCIWLHRLCIAEIQVVPFISHEMT